MFTGDVLVGKVNADIIPTQEVPVFELHTIVVSIVVIAVVEGVTASKG